VLFFLIIYISKEWNFSDPWKRHSWAAKPARVWEKATSERTEKFYNCKFHRVNAVSQGLL
jgi:hypothetical protein